MPVRPAISTSPGEPYNRSDSTLVEHIVANASQRPDAVAASFGASHLSYRQLDIASATLAARLGAWGVSRGDIVAVCLPRGLELIVALLAVLRAGAAYLPIDPETPVARIRMMLDDAAVPVVVTDATCQRLISGAGEDAPAVTNAAMPAFLLLAPGDAMSQAAADAALPTEGPGPEDLAYVIYTSGSTGKPKGVLIEHRGISNNLDWQLARFGFGPRDRFLLWTTISFDAALWELWTPLVAGATIVIADRDVARDPRETLRLIARESITFAQTVPGFLAAMLAEYEAEPVPLALRLFAVGGEALPAKTLQQWLDRTGIDLLNMYGPTECTVDATWRRYRPDERDCPITIGQPIANTRAFVLDPAMQPVAPGEAGELYLASLGLARGYLNRPELTQERFVPNPFGNWPSDRLYRTGDIVRQQDDGQLLFLGRSDDQIKIRGQRIELGEIDAALQTLPGVGEAMALVLRSDGREPRLVAALRTTDPAPDGAQLRRLLGERLPSAMVPDALIPVADFPRLISGKIDRKALAALLAAPAAAPARPDAVRTDAPPAGVNPAPDGESSGEPYGEPYGELEQQVAALAADLLGLPGVGRDEDFFTIGGHSIAAARLAARIRTTLGRECALATVMAHPTVARLTAAIRSAAPCRTATAIDTATFPGAAMDDPVPATPGQAGLWFLERLDGPSDRYHITEAWQLTGRLDIAALQAAMQTIVDRHDSLRTGFVERDGQPWLKVVDRARFALPIIDAKPGTEHELIETLARRPFALEHPPLLRACLLRTSPRDHLLVLVVHHLVADGWSMDVFEQELSQCYGARHDSGRSEPLPALPVSFLQHARRLAAPAMRQRQEQDLDWWQQTLAGLPGQTLRPDTSHAAGDAAHDAMAARPAGHVEDLADTVELALAADTEAALAALAAQHGLTRFMLLSAAFALLQARHSGQPDVAFLTPTDGRDDASAHGLIGYFVRLLPLRVDLTRAPDYLALAHLVRNALIGARAHDSVGWEQIVTRLATDTATGRRSGADAIPVCITFNVAPAMAPLPGLDVERVPLHNRLAKFDLALDVHSGEAGTRIVFEGRRARFDAAGLQALATQFAALLDDLLHDPQQALPRTTPVLSALPAAAAVNTAPPTTVTPTTVTPTAAGNDQSPAPAPAALVAVLTGIWQAVLERDEIASDADFFASGGHSLLAAQVAARVRAQTGLDMPLRALFDHPTIAGLAAWLAQQQAPAAPLGTTGAAEPTRQRATEPGVPTTVPLTDTQAGIWFLDRLHGPGSQYNMPEIFRIEGPLDSAAVQRALQSLVDRHEILRTRYAEHDGVACGHVEPRIRLDLPVVPTTPDNLDAAILAIAEQPFDLRVAPLLRACLLRLAPESHVLVLVLHHIAADGWSLDLLERELVQMLDPRALAPLPSPALQFADYAVWSRSAERRSAAESALTWWTTRLADLQPLDPRSLLGPAPDPASPLASPDTAGVLNLHLETPLARRLEAFAREQATTPFIVLAGLVKTLLMRISGQTDVAVLTPSADRPLEAFEHVPGCFLNLLVLRTELAGAADFASVLTRVRDTVADARQHDAVGYDRIVTALAAIDGGDRGTAAGGEGSRHGEGLVQVYLNLDMGVDEQIRFGAARAERIRLDARQAKFDLSFDFGLSDDGLRCTIEYRRARIDPAAVERLGEFLVTLLGGALANPATPLHQLALIDPAAQARQLEAWNATRQPWPSDRCVHQLIEAQAARTPDALAVVCGDRALSYRQLLDAAAVLAGRLRRLGAGPGRFVGICVERGPDMVVAMLATMTSGAAWVPLDPAFPVERLQMMAEDAGLLAVISESTQVQRLGPTPPPLILLDAPDDPADAAAGPIAQPDPADPIYMIYTSGSTGKPKGVVLGHRSVVNFLCSMAQQPGLSAQDQTLAVTTLSFDIAVLEILLPLCVGASVRIATREEAASGTQLRQLLEQTPVTLLQATPSTWRMLLDAGWPGKPGLKALIGGEALTASLARELLARSHALWNMYGPTETTVWSTCERIDSAATRITIGRPIANTTIRILDGHGQDCPPGTSGEILIGGDGLAIGYHARPELNQERFVWLTDGAGDRHRFYRTGDLGRWLGDGRIEHQGRIDHQVKLRGHRIELGEIEHALAAHPAVREAVATVRELRAGDQRLLAFVVPSGAQPLPGELRQWRAFLAQRLPEYMLPQHVIELAALPLLPNGKIDRARLPVPAADELTQLPASIDTPRSDTEQVLATIWAEVLGVPRVGRDDDFFDLGGHSLLALRLLHRVETQFGTLLRLAALFEAPTVARMAELIDAGEATAETGCAVVVSKGSGRPPLFIVTGWGGALLTVTRFGEELGPEQPLVVLDTGSFDANSGSLPDMAARMIRDMRRIQPTGPWQLCGYSQGGKFVHEIACQLRDAGETVHLLAFLDCDGPDYPRKRSFAGRVLRHASNLFRQDWRTNVDYVRHRFAWLTRVLMRTEGQLYTGNARDIAQSALGRQRQEASEAVTVVWENYRPRPYGGNLLLIRAGIRYEFAHLIDDDLYLGWRPFIQGEITLRTFEDTTHGQILDPDRAPGLATLLQPSLLQHAAPLATGAAPSPDRPGLPVPEATGLPAEMKPAAVTRVMAAPQAAPALTED